MNRKCNMVLTYMVMLIIPFSADMLSAAAQMTVKTVAPLILG
jgi:hypothetical protein